MDKKNVGVITEQGFVAGSGLGYKPVNEEDLFKDHKKNSSDDEDKSKKSLNNKNDTLHP